MQGGSRTEQLHGVPCVQGSPPSRQRALFGPLVSLYDNLVDVRESALKHGCSADDVLHAITNALVAYDDLDDPYVLYLGPDIAGTLLEVLTAVDEQGEEIAFHAMPMRRKYRRLLP